MTSIYSHRPLITPWDGDNFQPCHRHFYQRPGDKLSFPPEVEEQWEVVVVGAGLSGLTSAYHLREHRVLVLEAGKVPGGVCRQGSFRGLAYPAGSAYFYYPGDPSWEAWYRNLGLPLADSLVAKPVSALFYGGRWYPDCFSKPCIQTLPLPRRATNGLKNLAENLAAWEEVWDPMGSDSLPNPELDRISLAHFLENEQQLPPQVTSILAPYCRSCLGAGPETVSAWAGLFFLMSEFSANSRTAAFPGGNAMIAQALAQSLSPPVRCGQTLVRLEPAPHGVDLWVWDSLDNRGYRLQAGAVILALGKFAARHILPSHAGWNLEVFSRFRYSSYVVAALCGNISLESPGYENWIVGDENFSDFIMSPRTPRGGEARVMTVFAPQPHTQSREALLRIKPEDKATELLTAVERHFPGTAREVDEIHLYRFGHAQIVPYPGFLSTLKGNIAQAQERVILANSDLEGLPCIEAAIVQGQKAAQRARILLAEN
ncbi:MAG: FAD-dependent oxidoreductase [Syntrophales bacterium]|nr:FAD-dependent oxidoreductase [Syntrophales bacterium]